MFKKILIANRGEIAVRIIRCCKEMGIEAVAVYSSADATSLHVQLADEAYCIGPAKSSESYLNMENILSVATLSGCDAIHPGFGYLSENSTFARLVEECGMTFIGPSGDVIDQMGNKSVARQMMIEAGVPVVPGSNGSITSLEEGKELLIEAKKGKTNKSGQEYVLMREAIGQLMTSDKWTKSTIPVVAVPYSEKSYELAERWSKVAQIRRIGIGFMLVREDGVIEWVGYNR